MYVHTLAIVSLSTPTVNRLSCSATISIVDTGSSEITISWTPPSCSVGTPDNYQVQARDGSALVYNVTVATSSVNHTITSLNSGTSYVISLLVVDDCGPVEAASRNATTNSECTC